MPFLLIALPQPCEYTNLFRFKSKAYGVVHKRCMRAACEAAADDVSGLRFRMLFHSMCLTYATLVRLPEAALSMLVQCSFLPMRRLLWPAYFHQAHLVFLFNRIFLAVCGLDWQAGVHMVATGGIGGVHRGAEETFDISSDITELARTPVCVVSSGIKSILDIGKTLEQLETHAIPVGSLRTNRFPGFFTSDSGHASPLELADEAHAAQVVSHALTLGAGNGMLVGIPVPASEEVEGERIESAVQQALSEADAQRITGPETTPFVLRRVRELTGGESQRTNAALVAHNARVAAAIAAQMQLH